MPTILLEDPEGAYYLLCMYLDRLNKVPLRWGVFPRLKVWNIQEIGCVARLDRHSITGDFGKLGMIDVAYGENHPKEARDSSGPSLIGCQDNEETDYIIQAPKPRRIKGVGIPYFVSNHVCAESDVTSYEIYRQQNNFGDLV